MTTRPSTGRTTTETSLSTIAPSDTSTAELTAVVDELLGQLTQKFNSVSSELLSKMDDMSLRLDNLEATIQTGDGNSSKSAGAGK
ncbi:heat shock factor binding protein 1-domain-containing protein [Lophiotrema nucula]|uniref:Heat shock factor binding protein 1-domain-containing protein n=1 Tax=Lophiotrema nucula TaxID=690887 RepID=A0A6A5YXM0_9PLEO|nr:heat shock factor binding protein 1-domain-containing protein [Lophiotrema nucula]